MRSLGSIPSNTCDGEQEKGENLVKMFGIPGRYLSLWHLSKCKLERKLR